MRLRREAEHIGAQVAGRRQNTSGSPRSVRRGLPVGALEAAADPTPGLSSIMLHTVREVLECRCVVGHVSAQRGNQFLRSLCEA